MRLRVGSVRNENRDVIGWSMSDILCALTLNNGLSMRSKEILYLTKNVKLDYVTVVGFEKSPRGNLVSGWRRLNRNTR